MIGRLGAGAAAIFGTGLGWLLGAIWVGLLLGGVAYRKECVTADAGVTKSWSFEWFAPIPYIFRPDGGPNCVVHTGTRVALNAVGIAGYQSTSASLIADRAAKQSGDTTSAYMLKMRAALDVYTKGNQAAHSLAAGLKNVQAFERQLESITPPQRYAEAHARILRATQTIERHGNAMRAAALTGDTARLNQLLSEYAKPDAQRLVNALQQLNDLWASG